MGSKTFLRSRSPFRVPCLISMAIPMRVDLTADDAAGTVVMTETVSLEGGDTLYTTPETLFGSTDTAYFAVSDCPFVKVSVAYIADRAEKIADTGPAHVHEMDQQVTYWRMYLGEESVTWDGTANVNLGDFSTAPAARQTTASYVSLFWSGVVSECLWRTLGGCPRIVEWASRPLHVVLDFLCGTYMLRWFAKR